MEVAKAHSRVIQNFESTAANTNVMVWWIYKPDHQSCISLKYEMLTFSTCILEEACQAGQAPNTELVRILKRKGSVLLFQSQARLWICYQLCQTRCVNKRHFFDLCNQTMIFPSSPPSEKEDSGYEKVQRCYYSKTFRHPPTAARWPVGSWLMFPPLPKREFLWITRIQPVLKSQIPSVNVPHRNWSADVPVFCVHFIHW